jgi:predicted dehydrogenase
MSEPTAYKLKLGMVGGGPGAFIGGVHRTALALDGLFELVAGVFSSDPKKSHERARNWGIDPARVYSTFTEMANREAAVPEADRIDGVIIVTPNHLHEAVATAFLNARIPVICDKPMAATLEQAERMHALSIRSKVPLFVTYNYASYPLVRHATNLIREGKLGEIIKVSAQYHQGWLAKPIEKDNHKQASWRTDPAQAGAGALGDIGSHVENLVSEVTGLEIESLRAEVSTMVKGRKVDDDATVTLRYKGGAKGLYSVSQVCIGRENDLQFEVFGTKGSLAWRQENPNEMRFSTPDAATQILTRGSATVARLPAGHPEGFFEAFASVYNDAHGFIHLWKQGKADGLIPEHLSGRDGLRSLQFIDACLRSARDNGAWVTLT